MSLNIGKNILLTELDPAFITSEAELIKEFGYNVFTASSSDEAAVAVLNNNIDLALVDVEFCEEKDWNSTLEKIQNHNLPIVFLTSNPEEEIEKKTHGIIHYGFILKTSGKFAFRGAIEMAFELFEAHKKTIENEKKLRSYVENSPHGVFIADGNGNYIEVNSTACVITGYSEQELLSMNFIQLIPAEYHPQAFEHFQRVNLHGRSSGSMAFIKKDGSINYWNVEAVKLSDTRFIGYVSDITEQKKSEMELIKTKQQFSEERDILNQIIEHNPYAMQIVDKDGYTIRVNAAFRKLFGAIPLDNNSVFNDPILIKENLSGLFQRVLKGQLVNFPVFYYNVHEVFRELPDKPLWLEITAFPISNADGSIEKIILLHQDVTDREYALRSIKESEKRFRSAISTAPIGISVVNEKGNVEYINEKFVKMFGYTLEDYSSVDEWWPLAYPDPEYREKSIQKWNDSIQKIKDGQISSISEEYKIFCKDKSYRIVEISAAQNGRTVLVLFNDITERRKAEEELRERDALFRTVFDTVSDAIFVSSFPEGEIIACNDKLSGYKSSELIGNTTVDTRLWWDNSERDKIIKKMSSAGFIHDYEAEFRKKDGTGYTGSISINFIELKGKKYLVSVIRDITERRDAEKALEHERLLIDGIFNSVPGMIYLYNEESKLVKWNKKHVEMFGYTDEELYGMSLMDWFKGDEISRQKILEGVKTTVEKGYGETEADIQKKDGTKVPMYFTAVPLMIDGKLHFAGIGLDITERKIAENKLKESEYQLRMLTENIPDTVLQINKDGKINYVNRLMPGLTMEKVIGSSVFNWVPEKQFDVVQKALEMAFQEGKPFEYESEGPGPNGTWRQYFIRLMPVVIDNKIENAVFLTTDITERKNAEETIKKLLEEKELLLREVHHRIKNNMGTIINVLSLQADISHDEKVATALNETKSRVLSMQVLYDKLYRSANVSEVSLSEYIGPLIDEIIKNFPNHDKVHIDKNIENCLIDAKILSSLGIIVNELLTNSMKYAFPGYSKGEIFISSWLNGKEVTFIIQDFGIGMPESISIESSTGFGLRLVRLLTMQLRGKITMEKLNGTKFTLKFNI